MTAALILVCCALLIAWARAADASTITDARREVWRLWGTTHAPRMWCTIGRESGYLPWAVSRTGDHGLTQINARSWRRYFGERQWARVYDPVENVRMAYVIYRLQGFAAWAARCPAR